MSAPMKTGLALAAAGLAALLVSLLLGGAGGVDERPVNAGAGDLGDITANNSPTLARNPRAPDELAVASRIDSPDYSCALHVSGDGGESWTRTRVPIPPGPGRKCYAPDAVFAQDGTLHVSYVTLQGRGNTPSAAWVASSRDGGRSLSAPQKVSGPLAFQVRISTDPQRPRTLYVSWVQARDVGNLRFAGPGNPILVARSDDAGRSWTRPVQVNPASRDRVVAPSSAIGPRGEVYVVYLDLGGDRLDYEGAHDASGGAPYSGRFTLVLARSTDRGASWAESIVDDAVVPTTRFIAFLPPSPSLAVDPRDGRVYVTYQDRRAGTADIWLWALPPGAGDWEEPVRVNDTPRADRSSQYLPQVAVAPDGRVDVVYYDRREDAGRDLLNEVSLQSSRDDGRSFEERVTLSSAYTDARVGLGTERGLPDLGSRLGLESGDDEALAVWTDTRAGTDVSLKQDLYLGVASAKPLEGAATVLRYLGFALLICGVTVVAASVRRVRRSGR